MPGFLALDGESVPDFCGEAADVLFGGASADEEEIAGVGEFAQVEQGDFEGLFFQQDFHQAVDVGIFVLGHRVAFYWDRCAVSSRPMRR